MGKSGALFTKFWCMQAMSPFIMRIIVLDLFQHLHENDKSYFRESREQRFGTTLEAFAASDETTINTFRAGLTPLRQVLTRQPYLCGDQAYFADYVVLAQFLWARAVSPIHLLATDDPIDDWRDRLLTHFDVYLSGNHAPLFPIELVEKDFRYTLETAQACHAKMPISQQAHEVYRGAIAAGYGHQNITGIIQAFT